MSPTLELLKSLTLSDFPSGSSINCYHGKLYLIGDDANHILILDANYRKIDSVHLFDYPDKRIPKPEKLDFETSTVIKVDSKDHLLLLGSASLEKRMRINLIPLEQEGERVQTFQYVEFANRLKEKGISELNIEGSALIGNQLVLANRGNKENLVNHLITTEMDFWQRQHEANISISKIALPITDASFLGISELCYVESRDLLLSTFSSELTNNAYDDGVIGDSYLGWIDNIGYKVNTPNLKLDGMVNLAGVSEEFKGEKIEGICVERETENKLIAHLISDNDQGQSKLFKLRMTI